MGKAYVRKKHQKHPPCPYCGSERVTGIYAGEKLVRRHCYGCHSGWVVKG